MLCLLKKILTKPPSLGVHLDWGVFWPFRPFSGDIFSIKFIEFYKKIIDPGPGADPGVPGPGGPEFRSGGPKSGPGARKRPFRAVPLMGRGSISRGSRKSRLETGPEKGPRGPLLVWGAGNHGIPEKVAFFSPGGPESPPRVRGPEKWPRGAKKGPRKPVTSLSKTIFLARVFEIGNR